MLKNQTLINELRNYDVKYFSCTVFDSHKKPIISHCSSLEWLEEYKKKHLGHQGMPPVFKYISASPSKIIIWNLLNLDQEAEDFIKRRNKTVGVKNNISLLVSSNRNSAVITLGSDKETERLIYAIENTNQLGIFLNNLLITMSAV